MTAAEFARALNAKKTGKGKWIAKCPAHPDKRPSLSISEGKKVTVLLKCMSHGCDTRDILRAAGMTWRDLFDGKPTPEIRRRVALQDVKESLERQLGLVIMLQAMEKSKRKYWEAAERRIRWELYWTRCQLEPKTVVAEFRERLFWETVRRDGWDSIQPPRPPGPEHNRPYSWRNPPKT